MDTYSTSLFIRQEAGFVNNVHITDGAIDTHREMAYEIINSHVGMRYILPVLTDPNFVGSKAERLLRTLETQLGAAYMLINEYGEDAINSDKDGYKRRDMVLSHLMELRDGKIVLFGNDSAPLPGATTRQEGAMR